MGEGGRSCAWSDVDVHISHVCVALDPSFADRHTWALLGKGNAWGNSFSVWCNWDYPGPGTANPRAQKPPFPDNRSHPAACGIDPTYALSGIEPACVRVWIRATRNVVLPAVPDRVCWILYCMAPQQSDSLFTFRTQLLACRPSLSMQHWFLRRSETWRWQWKARRLLHWSSMCTGTTSWSCIRHLSLQSQGCTQCRRPAVAVFTYRWVHIRNRAVRFCHWLFKQAF